MRVWASRSVISSLSKTHLRILSPSHLNHLLQSCSDSRSLEQGKQVHQQVIFHGLDHHPFMATKLIQMYTDCDDLASARILFDRLPQPNVFAWTAILAFYSRNGMYKECLSTYVDMQILGVRPDGFIFPKVIRACAQSLCFKGGIQIHRDVIRFGSEFNMQVCNSLIDMYSKCGHVQMGRRIFDEMMHRDLLSWNSMISGYVSNGLLNLAIAMPHSMRAEGIEPDLVSWNTIMDAYCRMGLCEEALKIFEQIKEPNIISWTTLISGFSRTGNQKASLAIFRKMMTRGVYLPDPDALSSVLVSCRHLGALRYGREIHGYGMKTGSRLDFYSSAGAALMTLYAACGRVQDARNVFELMDKFDIVTWNAMILSFSHMGMDDSALKCFSEMQKIGIKNDENTISTILPVCDLKVGKQVHAYIRKSNFDMVTAVWNALMNMYSKCGCIQTAYTVFSKMGTRDVVSWNTMIAGYGMHGHGRAALQLLQEMNHLGLHPNSVTFTSVLSACSHSGLVDEALELFNSLTGDSDFIPTMEHFACIVDLLARAGRLEDALAFINKMPIEPDRRIWGSLLAACQDHQNVEIGSLAAEHLFCLETENPGNYVTLSNIYARAGKWDDAVGLRKIMEDRGVVKPSGCSWIECGG